ncbi:MAG: ABC transporter permease [Actinomycetes bacterium]
MSLPAVARSELLRRAAARLLTGVVLLFVISVLTFALVHLTPGDVVDNLLGTGRAVHDPAARAAITARWHLDDSLWTQYWSWLGHALRGDWGTSIHQQRPVATVLRHSGAITLQLVALATVISLALGIPLGVLSARKAGRSADQAVAAVAVTGISAPAFAVSFLLIYVFGYLLHWLPLYGAGHGVGGRLQHLLLPALALSIGLAAYLLKVTRSVMRRELARDYVTAARARGWRERRVTALGLRNGATPIVTSTGLLITYLLANSILVEQSFALPGLGRALTEAVQFKDIPLVQGATLLVAGLIIVISIAADLIAAVLDPRTRATGEGAL